MGPGDYHEPGRYKQYSRHAHTLFSGTSIGHARQPRPGIVQKVRSGDLASSARATRHDHAAAHTKSLWAPTRTQRKAVTVHLPIIGGPSHVPAFKSSYSAGCPHHSRGQPASSR